MESRIHREVYVRFGGEYLKTYIRNNARRWILSLLCAVNFVDYHKYNSNKRSYYGIRNISDRLCYENSLSVITPEKGRKGKSYIEYQAAKTGTSWKGKLKEKVDLLIPQVTDFEELLQKLQAYGYEIKRGKYVSCRAPGQERFTRLKTLGADYTEEAIRKRIAGENSRTKNIPKRENGISLLIDIENNIKAQQSAGYEHWAKIYNLKQAAKTMNFLTENNITQYEDLISRIDEIILDSERTADNLKQAEKKLSDMAVLIKNISTYQKTRPVPSCQRDRQRTDKADAVKFVSLFLPSSLNPPVLIFYNLPSFIDCLCLLLKGGKHLSYRGQLFP